MDTNLVPRMIGGPISNSTKSVVGIVKGATAGGESLTFMTPLSAAGSFFDQLGIDCPRNNAREVVSSAPAKPTLPRKTARFVNKPIVKLSDILEEALTISSRVTSQEELEQTFSVLPSLKLIGSTLRVEGPPAAAGADIHTEMYLSELNHQNSKILAGSAGVRIFVKDLVLDDASIQSFPQTLSPRRAGEVPQSQKVEVITGEMGCPQD